MPDAEMWRPRVEDAHIPVSQNPRPSVSVVIPYFNAGAFLTETLDCVLAQTVRPIEIVFVNDGSTAAQRAQLDAIGCSRGDIRIRTVDQPNQGPAAARNTGARAAVGTYLAFLDADDLWAPEKIQRQLEMAARRGSDVVLSDAMAITADGVPLRTVQLSKIPAEDLTRQIIRGNVRSFTSTILVRRSFFASSGGFDEDMRYCEDQLFLLTAVTSGTWCVAPEVLSFRRFHSGSTSSKEQVIAVSDVYIRSLELFMAQAKRLVGARSLRSDHGRRLVQYALRLYRAGARRQAMRTWWLGWKTWPVSSAAFRTGWMAATKLLRPHRRRRKTSDRIPEQAADLVILDGDYKAKQWARHAGESYNVVVEASRVAVARMLLASLLGRRRPPAVLFRYLNDRPKLTATVRKMIGEVLITTLATLSGSRVLWICHNVDRETLQFHPRLTRLRRWFVGKAADVVFVTDPLLVDPGRRLLPDYCAQKLTWTCFGSFSSYGEDKAWGNQTEPHVRQRVIEFVSRIRSEAREKGKRGLVGLCLSTFGEKYIHYDYASLLIEKAEETPFHVGLIISVGYGDTQSDSRRRVIRALRRNKQVLLFERAIGFHEDEMGAFYDFFWRGYADWSMPITVYGAAGARKPILALDSGFLPHLVREFGLGGVVGLDMADVQGALQVVSGWTAEGAERFLGTRSWRIGAERLVARGKVVNDG